MKFSFFQYLLIGLFLFISSCKKGCTDPLAYNYNSNKTIDNGNCNYYDLVYVDSIKIKRFPSVNQLGNTWDGGDSLDIDNDNTFPDIHIKVKTPIGYINEINHWPGSVNPFSCNLLFNCGNSISSNAWDQAGFTFYIYDYEYNLSLQLIDSLIISPFNFNGSGRSNRFIRKYELDSSSDEIDFTVYFHWD